MKHNRVNKNQNGTLVDTITIISDKSDAVYLWRKWV